MSRVARRSRGAGGHDYGDQAWTACSHGLRGEETGLEIVQRYLGWEAQDRRGHRQFRYLRVVGCATPRRGSGVLNPRFLLDTHIVIRWLSDSKRLSREQLLIIDSAERRGECVGVSAFSLIEIVLLAKGRQRINVR